MLNFIGSLPHISGGKFQTRWATCLSNLSRPSTCHCRRVHVHASAANYNPNDSEVSSSSIDPTVTSDNDNDDDVLSDDTHVVLDRDDINKLIKQLEESEEEERIKEDKHVDSDEFVGFDARFFDAAERMVDAREGRLTTTGTAPTTISETHESGTAAQSVDNVLPVDQPSVENIVESSTHAANSNADSSNNDVMDFEPMDYFSNDNTMYMPRWAREMYETNQHEKLEEASKRLVHGGSIQRLHDILERKKASNEPQDSVIKQGDGIVDCTVGDVADDYNLPVEFVVDAMIAFGIQPPVEAVQSISDSLTMEEIRRLLKLVTSFDSADLAERYSDRTIAELADDYDLNAEDILRTCERDGLYVHAGVDTHLSTVCEDRVLDILLKDEPFGKPYPSPLDGLE